MEYKFGILSDNLDSFTIIIGLKDTFNISDEETHKLLKNFTFCTETTARECVITFKKKKKKEKTLDK